MAVKWDKEFQMFQDKVITYNNIEIGIPDSSMLNMNIKLNKIDTILSRYGIEQDFVDTGFISNFISNFILSDINKNMPKKNIVVSQLSFSYDIRTEPMPVTDEITEIQIVNPAAPTEDFYYFISHDFGEEKGVILV